MPEAGTQTNLAHAGSGGLDWRGMGPPDPETGQRVSSGCRRKSGRWQMAEAGRMTSTGCAWVAAWQATAASRWHRSIRTFTLRKTS